ncbi:MAG: extracellular solute-binding protein, partial [Natronospirillum sp.]
KPYALPFYGESSITYYRADWVREAGLSMPVEPTLDDIESIASALHSPAQQRYGICLRGEPGWGSNMALINTMANTHGARWYDMDWQPQINSDAWEATVTRYARLMNRYGPPDPATLNFNRLLSHFQNGECGIWVDATVAASMVQQNGEVGFAAAPHAVTDRGKQWLWSWALAVPYTSPNAGAAWDFVEWATSADYHQLVADNLGVRRIPPGTLVSLYNNPVYRRVAPFADITLNAIQQADSTSPTQDPVPYQGIQFVGIPEYAFIADQLGRKILGVVQGEITVRKAIDDTQLVAEAYMAIQQRISRAQAIN